MYASFSAELLKLRRRRAAQVLLALMALAVVLFGYVFLYIAGQFPGEETPPDVLTMIREVVLVQHVPGTVITILRQFGGPLALILGALAIGGEFSWGTLKVILTQGPRRASIMGGKLLGLAALLLAAVLLCFAAALATSLGLAALTGAAVRLPSVVTIVGAIGAAWLILSAWGALGALLAALFRSSSAAIGLGLVYALLIENIIGLVAGASSALRAVHETLLGPSGLFLASGFPPGTAGAVSPLRAAVTLGIVTIICAVLSVATVARRDVG